MRENDMNQDNQHYGPLGAMNDQNPVDGVLETGKQFQPKDLETWEQDSNQVLNISPEQGPDGLNLMKQVPVGIHNK